VSHSLSKEFRWETICERTVGSKCIINYVQLPPHQCSQRKLFWHAIVSTSEGFSTLQETQINLASCVLLVEGGRGSASDTTIYIGQKRAIEAMNTSQKCSDKCISPARSVGWRIYTSFSRMGLLRGTQSNTTAWKNIKTCAILEQKILRESYRELSNFSFCKWTTSNAKRIQRFDIHCRYHLQSVYRLSVFGSFFPITSSAVSHDH
jgi:hypothetical protein